MDLSQNDLRWERRGDRGARNEFVITVKTTGIYCRPGCPAHSPLRKNVRFYDRTGEARAAGFRACKRCRPDT